MLMCHHLPSLSPIGLVLAGASMLIPPAPSFAHICPPGSLGLSQERYNYSWRINRSWVVLRRRVTLCLSRHQYVLVFDLFFFALNYCFFLFCEIFKKSSSDISVALFLRITLFLSFFLFLTFLTSSIGSLFSLPVWEFIH